MERPHRLRPEETWHSTKTGILWSRIGKPGVQHILSPCPHHQLGSRYCVPCVIARSGHPDLGVTNARSRESYQSTFSVVPDNV